VLGCTEHGRVYIEIVKGRRIGLSSYDIRMREMPAPRFAFRDEAQRR